MFETQIFTSTKRQNGFVYPRIVEGSLYIKVIFLQKNAYLSIRKKHLPKLS